MPIGPGAQKVVASNQPSALADATEFDYVTLLNPFSEDFIVRVGQDVPVNAPFTIGKDITGQTNQITHNERDAAQVYGLNLKNNNYVGKKHIAIDSIIPAGKTRRFKGNEAKVALTQIVNELIQHEGMTKLMSDPEVRAAAEARVIISRGSIQDLMQDNFQLPQAQADEAIRKANEADEGLNQPAGAGLGEASQSSGVVSLQSERRSPGRPKKA